jgi:hypothetical protein
LAERAACEHPRSDGVITAEYLSACVRRLLEDEDALVLGAYGVTVSIPVSFPRC